MRREEREFETAHEAIAFLDGIEYVNDSALRARINDDDPLRVHIEDEDYGDVEDDEEGGDEHVRSD